MTNEPTAAEPTATEPAVAEPAAAEPVTTEPAAAPDVAVAHHHGLVDQADERVHDLVSGQRRVRADFLRRRHVE